MCIRDRIYTSGSTGLPKGVQVEHRNAVALMATMNQLYHFDETDVWTQFQSYSFDFSVWEIWGVLLTGGQMLVIDFTTSRSPAEFVELLHAARGTVLCQTCLLYTSPSPRDRTRYRMPSSALKKKTTQCVTHIVDLLMHL